MCEWVTAQMIRQYVYCPRKIYFAYVLGLNPARTPQIMRGKSLHEKIWYMPRNIKKRGRVKDIFRAYVVNDPKTCIRGQIDILLRLVDDTYVPIEIKTGFSISPDPQHVAQLEAYLVILNNTNHKAKYGILYYKDKKKRFEIKYSSRTQEKIVNIANRIRRIIRESLMPATTSISKKCNPCEYKKFCRG